MKCEINLFIHVVCLYSYVALSDAPQKLSALESNIVKLEQASTRADAVQSFADLYESAGAKTLLVRTKYKYVRMQDIEFCFLERYSNCICKRMYIFNLHINSLM